MPIYDNLNLVQDNRFSAYKKIEDYYNSISDHVDNIITAMEDPKPQTILQSNFAIKNKLQTADSNESNIHQVPSSPRKSRKINKFFNIKLTGYIDCIGRYILLLSDYYIEKKEDLIDLLNISKSKYNKILEDIDNSHLIADKLLLDISQKLKLKNKNIYLDDNIVNSILRINDLLNFNNQAYKQIYNVYNLPYSIF